ncbi:MAG: FtsQ-type POTRA domain-containing protein [Chitinispirillales bacterium]|jgi:cell division septal protein FtsQ|nr:FtsQ-type POTRA domain-containing protein [Chitinispirillales bacterium]
MAKKIIGPKTQKMIIEQKREKSKIINKFLFYICIVMGISAVFLQIYPKICKKTKSFVTIYNYTVKGMENMDSVEIINCIELDENSNFFNIHTDSITRKIERIKCVEKAKVSVNPFSNSLDIKIIQRVPSFIVNIENELYWADKNGFLWKNPKLHKTDGYCLIVGLESHKDEIGNKITKNDMERLQKTYSRIKGKANSNNIKAISFKENDIIEFAASNISVPIVRLNATLRYGMDEIIKFEDILRKNGRPPVKYFDIYENAIFAK